MKKIVALGLALILSLTSLAGLQPEDAGKRDRDHKRRCFKRADRNGHGKSNGYGR